MLDLKSTHHSGPSPVLLFPSVFTWRMERSEARLVLFSPKSGMDIRFLLLILFFAPCPCGTLHDGYDWHPR